MLKINVVFVIWQKVKWLLSWEEYIVIWYDYIDKRWVRYIISNWKSDYIYKYEVELEWIQKERNIWFNTKK